jgi:hypothetical protein
MNEEIDEWESWSPTGRLRWSRVTDADYTNAIRAIQGNGWVRLEQEMYVVDDKYKGAVAWRTVEVEEG